MGFFLSTRFISINSSFSTLYSSKYCFFPPFSSLSSFSINNFFKIFIEESLVFLISTIFRRIVDSFQKKRVSPWKECAIIPREKSVLHFLLTPSLWKKKREERDGRGGPLRVVAHSTARNEERETCETARTRVPLFVYSLSCSAFSVFCFFLASRGTIHFRFFLLFFFHATSTPLSFFPFLFLLSPFSPSSF